MSQFACGRCYSCDDMNDFQNCLHPRGSPNPGEELYVTPIQRIGDIIEKRCQNAMDNAAQQDMQLPTQMSRLWAAFGILVDEIAELKFKLEKK